jgi:hypothetical protein
VNLALVGHLAERFDLTDTGSRDALNLVVSRMLEPPAVSMCSTMAGSSTFLVAGGKAIFMNSSVPLLGEWARGPERSRTFDFWPLATTQKGIIYNSRPGGGACASSSTII